MKDLAKSAGSLKIICYYTGWIIIGTAALMMLPVIIALLFNEWEPLLDFIISMCTAMLCGIGLMLLGWHTRQEKASIQWKHGFIVAALAWMLLMVLCALPYYLSGHSQSYLDACFDVMSGFTTTGLVLTQDLDHLSVALNVWRHILTFIGGQGMVVLALAFLTKETSGAYRLYVGEAKDIELVPNVKGTAKIIWKISMIYLAVGMAVLWVVGIMIGLKPLSALLHAFYMFSSSWSTGGFAPMTQNIMYYHSFAYETITMVFFILGSFNFGLHYAVWQGNKKELLRNIETKSFLITSFILSMAAMFWLMRLNVYPDAVSAFRRIVFNILSANTTTGLGSIYARQFLFDWGDMGILIMVIAMLIGGSACSTAGGFKGLRVGILCKAIVMDIKKLLSSERNMKAFKYHHIKDRILDDTVVKSSAQIVLYYLVLFAGGTLLGVFYGYPLADSAFESASVTGNVGLSIGITAASMPTAIKLYDIFAMYLARLEFLSVFALVGYLIGGAKKLCRRS